MTDNFLPRVLEPEVMDTAEEAADYDAMDHRAVNERFVDDWIEAWVPRSGSRARPHLLDVGTGTALIPLEYARRNLTLQITAVDLAEEMLTLARENVRRSNAQSVIRLQRVDAKELPFETGQFDSVVSNSIIHHIPQPIESLREMVRVLAPGGLLFVRDLYRPRDSETVESLVSQYAGGETPRQQQLFRQSFHAALTMDEVSDMLEEVSLPRDSVRMTSDRHWTITAWKP
jgi:ubiquinone/menaquinone biosynthesis C-methylase UbiE